MIFVGEIGIPRREYLYDLQFWEILLIGRGYARRHHPGWEQARLMAYHAAHCMGSKHQPPPLEQWITFTWEKPLLPSDDIINQTRRQLQAENKMRENNI